MINFYFNLLYIKSLWRRPWNEHAQVRPPLMRHGFFMKSWAAPTLWWCCLSCCLCFLCGFWLVTCQFCLLYVQHFRGVTKWATQACTISPAVAYKQGKNLYLGQFWPHVLVRAFKFVLLVLTVLITSTSFGWDVFLLKIELIVFLFGTGPFG